MCAGACSEHSAAEKGVSPLVLSANTLKTYAHRPSKRGTLDPHFKSIVSHETK